MNLRELLKNKISFYIRIMKFSVVFAIIIGPMSVLIAYWPVYALTSVAGIMIGFTLVRTYPNILDVIRKKLLKFSHYLFYGADTHHC